MADRHLSLPYINSQAYTIPRYMPGRLTAEDFVFFIIPESLKPYASRYTVTVTILDNAGSNVRKLCPLQHSVELPNVRLYTVIGLIPDSPELPMFEGELVRGGTYSIPTINIPLHPQQHARYLLKLVGGQRLHTTL